MEENNLTPQAPTAKQNAPLVQVAPQDSNVLKPKSKLFLIIIGLVLFLLIAGSMVGYFIFKNRNSNLAKKSVPVPTQAVVLTPTPDPTASWKTYNENGVSFKYPEDWNVIDDGGGYDSTMKLAGFGLRLQKDINAREADESLTIRSDDSVTDGATTSVYLLNNDRKFTKTTNNIDFIKFDEGGRQVYSVCVFRNPKQETIEICNQILSTLKFNQKQNTDLTVQLPLDWYFMENSAQRIFVVQENGMNNLTFTKYQNQNLDEMIQLAKMGIVRDLNSSKHVIDGVEVTEYSGCLNPEVCNRVSNIVLPVQDAYYIVHAPDIDQALLEKILAGVRLKQKVNN